MNLPKYVSDKVNFYIWRKSINLVNNEYKKKFKWNNKAFFPYLYTTWRILEKERFIDSLSRYTVHFMGIYNKKIIKFNYRNIEIRFKDSQEQYDNHAITYPDIYNLNGWFNFTNSEHMFPVGQEHPEIIFPIIPKNYQYTNGNLYTDIGREYFTNIRKNTFSNWVQINSFI